MIKESLLFSLRRAMIILIPPRKMEDEEVQKVYMKTR